MPPPVAILAADAGPGPVSRPSSLSSRSSTPNCCTPTPPTLHYQATPPAPPEPSMTLASQLGVSRPSSPFREIRESRGHAKAFYLAASTERDERRRQEHHQRRLSKLKARQAPHHYTAAAPSTSRSTMSEPATYTATTTAAAAASAAAVASGRPGQRPERTSTHVNLDPPVTSYWGVEPLPLPSRFARIKSALVHGHEAALEASWKRLIVALRSEVDHIEGLGMHLIPSIDFADMHDANQAARFSEALKRYGVAVVRGVISRDEADAGVAATMEYVRGKRVKTILSDPTCHDFYWSPAQMRMRAHPRVLEAQRFMMSLWETPEDAQLMPQYPITYADRIRIHGSQPSLQSETPQSPSQPKSADDWLAQLHSSGGIIVQVDNGSLERWEPDGYHCSNSDTRSAHSSSPPAHVGTYDAVFRGDWESYDPWECASRVSATTDLYNGHGACSMFRMYQGMLALSTIEPGIIRFLPSPKLAVAYFLLRPFFSPKTPPPAVRSGPAWDAFLAADNWALDATQSSIVHGAVPGHAQRLTELWHPHLHLRRSVVTLPTLQAGDYMFWHPDVAYHVNGNFGRTADDVSVLVYIPAAPLTQTNALYLARQRKAFQRGHAAPDFDSSGSRMGSEASDGSRPKEEDIAQFGPAALQAMGLAPWELATSRAEAAGDQCENAGRPTRAEAEVVRLANIILFPDRCM